MLNPQTDDKKEPSTLLRSLLSNALKHIDINGTVSEPDRPTTASSPPPSAVSDDEVIEYFF